MGRAYGKLVRDNIPAIIEAGGEKPLTRTLNDAEYLQALIAKLQEETAEFEADHSVEELADIKEVVIAIREAIGVHAGDLEDVRRTKARNNGRYKQRIYLEGVA
jgi:predicted house-cleaning noncanonical NTP pyrophosphatase (MazG superfamily)